MCLRHVFDEILCTRKLWIHRASSGSGRFTLGLWWRLGMGLGPILERLNVFQWGWCHCRCRLKRVCFIILWGKRSQNLIFKGVSCFIHLNGKRILRSVFFNVQKSCLLIWRVLDMNLSLFRMSRQYSLKLRSKPARRYLLIQLNAVPTHPLPRFPKQIQRKKSISLYISCLKTKTSWLTVTKNGLFCPPPPLKESSHILLIVMIVRPRKFYCPSWNIEPL